MKTAAPLLAGILTLVAWFAPSPPARALDLTPLAGRYNATCRITSDGNTIVLRRRHHYGAPYCQWRQSRPHEDHRLRSDPRQLARHQCRPPRKPHAFQNAPDQGQQRPHGLLLPPARKQPLRRQPPAAHVPARKLHRGHSLRGHPLHAALQRHEALHCRRRHRKRLLCDGHLARHQGRS